MWELFKESITDTLRVTCNILAFVIPYVIYKINLKLHELADPPWKKDKAKEQFRGSKVPLILLRNINCYFSELFIFIQ